MSHRDTYDQVHELYSTGTCTLSLPAPLHPALKACSNRPKIMPAIHLLVPFSKIVTRSGNLNDRVHSSCSVCIFAPHLSIPH